VDFQVSEGENNPAQWSGWKARKLPATGEVLFLDSPSWNLSSIDGDDKSMAGWPCGHFSYQRCAIHLLYPVAQ